MSVCGIQHVYLSWYLIGSSFVLNCTSAFLCACVCTCVVTCVWNLSTCMSVVSLSLGQALDILLAGITVCGFSSLSCRSGGRKRCVPPKPPASHPPPLVRQAAHSLLFLLSFSRAPEPRLWPVDECYILAVSTGVSWGLACGGSAVSGPVCQLLVPLPPTHQRRLQPVDHTCAASSCDWLRSLAWKWKDRPQNRHIHNHANVKGLFKTFKCSGVVFLNRPWKLWQMVYYFSQYFISGTFSCCLLTSV